MVTAPRPATVAVAPASLNLSRDRCDYGKIAKVDAMRISALAVSALFLSMIGSALPVLAQESPAVVCRQGQPKEAIAACSGILSRTDLAPEVRALTLSNRGNAHVKLKDLDSALVDFDAAIKLNPRLAAAHNFRGIALRLRGDYELAIESYNTAISLQPQVAVHYTNRGIAHRWRRDYDRALADFEQAIKLNPNASMAYGERAIIHRIKQDFTRALADHAGMIKIAPQSWQSYSYRAYTHEARNDLRSALADFVKAQEISPRDELTRGIKRIEGKLAKQATAPQGPAPKSGPGASSSLPQAGAQRVALVIGNGSYRNAGALPNPRNDALAVGRALNGLGFQVVVAHDLTREQLTATLKEFSALADNAEWAVIYYAGHGIELGGTNYLVPVDAKFTSDRDVSFEAVMLEQVLLSVEGASKLRLVILDACRDNPFAKTMIRSSGSRSVGKGLGNIEPEGTTLVAYAAKHGQTAEDGGERNSPYAAALVRSIQTPGMEINQVFRKVHDDVMAATGKRQQPFTYGALPSESFFFRTK
jgi:tetratricopeptide (TPR) repeat protein